MPHLGHAGFDTEILWEPPAPREVPINIRDDDSLVASLVAKAEHRPRAVMITSEELNAIPIISVPPRGWRVQVVGRYPTSSIERLRHVYWALHGKGVARTTTALRAICDRRI